MSLRISGVVVAVIGFGLAGAGVVDVGGQDRAMRTDGDAPSSRRVVPAASDEGGGGGGGGDGDGDGDGDDSGTWLRPRRSIAARAGKLLAWLVVIGGASLALGAHYLLRAKPYT